MTKKQFIFSEYEINPTDDFINNLKLYEIDNKNTSSSDYSDYFVVYCDSEENIKSMTNKLNELADEIEYLKYINSIYNDLGILPFSSAKAICDKLNEQDKRIKKLEEEKAALRQDND